MIQSVRYLVYAIIGLAFIGLFGQLFLNPTGFLKGILMSIGFAVVIGVILYYFFFGRQSTQHAKYRKAVKQSKRKYGSMEQINSASTAIRKPIKIRNNQQRTHLKVIKGNKK